MCMHQGNLRGESVVAAILASHMKQSYFTSAFFLSKPAKQALVAFPAWTKSRVHIGYGISG